jgi:ribosomal protein S18 acetylase RimI-like enzyme
MIYIRFSRSEGDVNESLKIAEELSLWFTKEALENMKKDFNSDNLIVCKNENEVIGFLCYSKLDKNMKILWMAVRKDFQRKGIGRKLLNFLFNEAKNLGISCILVETLTDKDDYEPYIATRDFYYKNGFKKIGYKPAEKEGWDDQIILEKRL